MEYLKSSMFGYKPMNTSKIPDVFVIIIVSQAGATLFFFAAGY